MRPSTPAPPGHLLARMAARALGTDRAATPRRPAYFEGATGLTEAIAAAGPSGPVPGFAPPPEEPDAAEETQDLGVRPARRGVPPGAAGPERSTGPDAPGSPTRPPRRGDRVRTGKPEVVEIEEVTTPAIAPAPTAPAVRPATRSRAADPASVVATRLAHSDSPHAARAAALRERAAPTPAADTRGPVPARVPGSPPAEPARPGRAELRPAPRAAAPPASSLSARRGEPATGRMPPAAAPERPSVQVTIGRIEVRAVRAPDSPAEPARLPAEPAVSLDDYLARRRGSGGTGGAR